MTQFLPPNLLALFAPRDPIPYLPPPDKLPHEKKNVHNYIGIAQFVKGNFEDPKDTPPPTRVETRVERLERKKRDKEEQVAYKLEQEIALWDPTAAPDDAVTTDPFKTLFVGRINNYTSENKIRREFESYGPIKTIQMVHDKEPTGKPKGYCFIEFEHERDMHSAYKRADGKKLDGRRVLVDVERGRTVKGWLPRRLGGGLGGTRRGGPDMNVRHSGREDGSGRERGDRYERSRSPRERDRRRKRSRSRSRDRSERKRTRRSRSRDRERRRSRSREKKKSRRSSRSRSREKRDRKDRERDGRKGRIEEGDVDIKEEPEWKDEVNIKEEPLDENGGYGGYDEMYEDPSTRKIKEERNYDERKPQIIDNGYYEGGNYD